MLVKYGDRFKEIREREGLSQGDVAARLKLEKERGSSVSNIERHTPRAPARIGTIRRHATALGCQPWELLAGVTSELDRLRSPIPLSDAELSALLWGLAYLTPTQRSVALEQMQSFLDALPPGAAPPQAAQPDPVRLAKVPRSNRRRKRA